LALTGFNKSSGPTPSLSARRSADFNVRALSTLDSPEIRSVELQFMSQRFLAQSAGIANPRNVQSNDALEIALCHPSNSA
jgi:hypothetical protein